MAVTTSDKAVTDYLDNLLNDLSLGNEPVAPSTTTQPLDSIDVTRRVIPLWDPFQLMDMNQISTNPNVLWLGVHVLLPLCRQLPPSAVKQYCLAQCQALFKQAQRATR